MRSYPKREEERDGQIGVYTYLRELGAASATIRPSHEAKGTQVPRPEDPGPAGGFRPPPGHPGGSAPRGKDRPARDWPARDWPAKDWPAKDWPAKDWPAKDWPAKDWPGKKDRTVPGRVGLGAGGPGAGGPGAGTGVGGGGEALVWPVPTEPAPAAIGPYVHVAVVEG